MMMSVICINREIRCLREFLLPLAWKVLDLCYATSGGEVSPRLYPLNTVFNKYKMLKYALIVIK